MTMTGAPVSRERKDTSRATFFTYAMTILLLMACLGVILLWVIITSGGPKTNVVVGQLYNVLVASCEGKFDKGDGKAVSERMYDVHFAGPDRMMMNQVVLPSMVKKNLDLSPGTGRWVFIDLPVIEGIDYGWYREFQYNGELQPASQIPTCVPRQ